MKAIFKKMLPLIIGILIGAGITRNKAVLGILIAVIALMLLRNALTKASKYKGSRTKKVGISLANWYITEVENGFRLADNLYHDFYSTWIAIINILLLIFGIKSLWQGNWLWAFVLFIALQVIITQNQIWRVVKHAKIIKD